MIIKVFFFYDLQTKPVINKIRINKDVIYNGDNNFSTSQIKLIIKKTSKTI